jgi:60 kDa SS-A/Ro ribonucleoprotein
MSHQTYTTISNKVTSQTDPVLGKNQVQNNQDGYVFEVDVWARVARFCILGSSGGSYYVKEKALTRENAEAIEAALKLDGPRVVKTIVEISDAGRAIKNDSSVFALAMCAGLGDEATKKLALAALPKVCRIGTDLFHFATYVEQFRGWGSGLRKSVAKWYTEKSPDKLEFQLVKYQQRDGWSHKDLMRLSHPTTDKTEVNQALRWASGKFGMEKDTATNKWIKSQIKYDTDMTLAKEWLPVIYGYERVLSETDEKKIASLVTEYRLPMEAIPTEKRSKLVLEAVLPNLGLTGLIRNLGSFTAKGIFDQHTDATKFAIERILNEQALKKARVHPIKLLGALMTYKQGHGFRGDNTWIPVGKICDALDEAFYLSFKHVEPSNSRMFLALDLSASMTWESSEISAIPGMHAREASAALAMVTMRTEKDWGIYGFTSTGTWSENDGISPLSLSPKMLLGNVIDEIQMRLAGGTDCSLPMIYAAQHKIPVDTFVVYTDSETAHGSIHPYQALRNYRNTMGIPAKLIVVGMVSNGFTIADPEDAGMIDVVGFDTNTPTMISDFAAGKI